MVTLQRVRWATIGALAMVVCAACSVGGATAVTEIDGMVTLEGTLAAIRDDTPVDGGVTLTVELPEGATEVLTFGSLFTNPPPGEERIALYQKIAEAKVGDRVRATGERREGGIEIVAFQILES